MAKPLSRLIDVNRPPDSAPPQRDRRWRGRADAVQDPGRPGTDWSRCPDTPMSRSRCSPLLPVTARPQQPLPPRTDPTREPTAQLRRSMPRSSASTVGTSGRPRRAGRKSRILIGLARIALAAVPGLAWPAALSAQGNDAQADRLDRQLDRIATPPPATPALVGLVDGGLPPPQFPQDQVTFIALFPVMWTSNAGYADDDPETAAHGTPSLELRASRTYRRLRLEGRAALSSDIYSRAEENNLSFVRLRFEIGATDPGPLNFVPYLRYQPVVEFSDAHLGDYSKTKHDFSIGAVNKFTGGNLRLFATRRESTDPNAERFQLGGQLTFEGPLGSNPRWSWSFVQSLEARFFTGGTNDGRRDIYASANGTISWRRSSTSAWTFNALDVTAEWNQSDVAGRDYFVVNAGSSISFRF